MNEATDSTRRQTLGLMALSAAIVATSGAGALAAVPDGDSPEAMFLAAFGAPADKPEAGAAMRLAFLHENALIIDHGAPFPLNKAGYADHLAFQLANLQRSETRFHDISVARHGETAIVSAYFIERTKPRDAGFRLRAGYCTAVCTRTAGSWKALSLHLSPLTAQVTDASPG